MINLRLPTNYALADHWNIIEAMLEKYPNSKMLFDNHGVFFYDEVDERKDIYEN